MNQLSDEFNTNLTREFHFFDAHCHLQEPEIIWDIQGIMERWEQNMGSTIVCCGTKESDWQAVADIASQYSNIFPCFGVHPWFVEDVSKRWFYELDSYLDTAFDCAEDSVCNSQKPSVEDFDEQMSKSSAGQRKKTFIGEIGLDHVLKNIDRAKQEIVFKTQMGMARERKIPVSIHMRKGWDILIKILKQMGPLPAGGLVHSYSGPADIVPLLEKYGLYISFSASVTNSDNKKVAKSLKAVSPDRLLIETDSPAILPRYPASEFPIYYSFDQLSEIKNFVRSTELFDMGWNEPCNIFMVAIAVSRTLGIPLFEVAKQTVINGNRLFLR